MVDASNFCLHVVEDFFVNGDVKVAVKGVLLVVLLVHQGSDQFLVDQEVAFKLLILLPQLLHLDPHLCDFQL